MPVTIGIIAAVPGMIKLGAGLVQSIEAGSRAHREQNQLANMKTPVYQPSKAIGDYYQQALARYNTSPYQSAMYQQAQANINQRQGTALGALQDRRQGLAGIGSLMDQAGQQSQGAVLNAERMRGQNLSMLGRSAQMQAGQDQEGYMYNQLLPYQRQSSLLAARAAGNNQVMNAGLQNIFGGLGSTGMMASSMAQQGLFGMGGGGGGAGGSGANSNATAEPVDQGQGWTW